MSDSERHGLNVSAEFTMVMGFGMCVLGFTTKMMWWTFGGILLFYMGVMALGAPEGQQKASESPPRRKLAFEERVSLYLFVYAVIVAFVALSELRLSERAIMAVSSYCVLYGAFLAGMRRKSRRAVRGGERDPMTAQAQARP